MIGPFFSYYGGKHRMARTLYEPPEFGTIIEPFAGGAGYSCQYPDRNVILYDKNEKLVGAWQYLIATPAEEILAPILLGEAEERLRHARRMADKVHAIETWEKYGEKA